MADKRDLATIQNEELEKFRIRIEMLRRTYDQYLLGHEKVEPTREREKLELQFKASKLMLTPYSVIRFQFQNLVARYRMHSARWDRVQRNRELDLSREIRTGVISDGHGPTPTEPADDADAKEQTPQEKKAKAKRLSSTAKEAEELASELTKPRKKKTPPDGLRAVYDEWVQAKKALGQDQSKVGYERFRVRLAKQQDQATKKGMDLSFKVEVDGDKVTIVPKTRKSVT